MAYNRPVLDGELSFKTSRSGGAGGQHVNKVATKVQLEFDVAQSKVLSSEEIAILLERLQNRLTADSILKLVAQTERTQGGNKVVVVEKFYKLLERALAIPKPRMATKPSKSSVQRRLTGKKRDAEIKNLRRRIDE
jgi:ribosome-associated protein